jgi:hypothetical protein
MQKKKPSFQVIPNCGINGVTNWNESKEVPTEQGLQGYWPAQPPPTAAGLFGTPIAIAKLSR